MEGVFACPDCGSEIQVQGLSPGREMRCDWCSARVEVPFIPRAEQIKRLRTIGRGRRRFWPRWVWCLVGLLCVMIVAAGLNRWIQARWRSDESDSLAKLIAISEKAEKAGRLDDALVHLEGALVLLKKRNPTVVSTELSELTNRRDDLARGDFMKGLEALRKAPHYASVDLEPIIGRGLNLLARARSDSALIDFDDQVVAELDRLRTLWAVSDAIHAEAALKAGEFAKAAEYSEHQYETAEHIPAADRLPQQVMASNRVESIIRRCGLVVEFAPSSYTLGSDKTYAGLLLPSLKSTMIRSGYYPKPSKTVFERQWRKNVPFRLVITIKERREGAYYQSANRLSYLQSQLEFLRGDRRLMLQTANAQSAVPLPGLATFVANRVALGTQRSAEFERMLYENARSALLERLGLSFKSLPRFDTL